MAESAAQRQSLSIVHINTHDVAGGAAKVAWRLMEAQRAAGLDSKMLVGIAMDRSGRSNAFPPEIDRGLQEYCSRQGQLFYEYQGSHRLVKNPLVRSADILHLHNLHGDYFNPFSLSALSHLKPVVWTLHDMQSITGHCAHSFDCQKWQDNCLPCPCLTIEPALKTDSASQLLADKRLVYDHSYLWAVTPSQWLKSKVEKSILKDHPVELIYNGVDTNVFRPHDKQQARQKWGIPQDAFVVGAVGHGGTLTNQWKGGQYTQQALEALWSQLPGCMFVNIGANVRSADPRIINIPSIQDENQLARAYSVLDVFLYTPIADNCPLVVLEALSCGVPIVTFATGGVPELVRSGRDGFVTSYKEIAETVRAVKTLAADSPLRDRFGYNCREAAVTKFDHRLIAGQYEKLYRKILQENQYLKKTVKLFPVQQIPQVIRTPVFFHAEESKGQIQYDSPIVRPLHPASQGLSILNHPDDLTFSKKSHFAYFETQKYDIELFGKKVDAATCDLKMYQDLLVFAFIKENVPKGSRILDVGGGDSRILKHFYEDYECWNIDPLDGSGSGLTTLNSQGRYRLIQDYMGNFNRELPDNYFDFVFSISALEHVPQQDPAVFEKVRDDMNRVLKAGGYSLHCFDVVIKQESVWTNALLQLLFNTQNTLNRWIPLESLRSEPDLYFMTESAYNRRWRDVTQELYEQFGKPLSYNILWQKTSVQANPQGLVPSFNVGSSASCPKITVVTPSFNQARYLQACIESVLSQNYPNLEYIIMDGGSNDGSVEIIKKYEKYLGYWQSQPDGGQYRAVEEGFKRSTGRIMTWLNSDDKFFPDAFQTAAAIFTNRPEIDWITGKTVNFEEDGAIRLIMDKLCLWNRARYLNMQYNDPYIQQEGSFWRRSLWEKAGACMNRQLEYAGDLELWTRFFRHAHLYSVEVPLAGYRVQPNSKISKFLEKYVAEAQDVLKQEIESFKRQSNHQLPPPPSSVSASQVERYVQVFQSQIGISTQGDRLQVSRQEKAAITLATSLTPRNTDNQYLAVQSWIRNGFDVISINTQEEIKKLRMFYTNVRFIPAARDGRKFYKKSLIFIDDLLHALKGSQSDIVGIINSDIHLRMNSGQVELIRRQAADSLICVSRTNIDRLDECSGSLFMNGFDVFFFNQNIIDKIIPSLFCLGVTWWDYYLPAVAALKRVPLVRLYDNIAFHVKHKSNWDVEQWIRTGKYFFEKIADSYKNTKGIHCLSGLTERMNICMDYLQKVIDRKSIEPVDIERGYQFAEFMIGFLFGNMKVIGDNSASELLCPASSGSDTKQQRRIDALSSENYGINQQSHNCPADSGVVERLINPGTAGPVQVCDPQENQNVDSQGAEYDVSIVLATKNRAKLLDPMLTSLKAAAVGLRCEIIVIEGGSSDDTAAVLRKHQVTRIYDETQCLGSSRHGWPQLYNFGFSKARGKWAMYASDDTIFGKESLRRGVELLNQQAVEVAGGIFFYKNVRAQTGWDQFGIDFTDGPKLLLNYGLVRLDDFKKVGGLDTSYKFYCADTDLCYKLYYSGRQLIPLPGCFVVHNNILDAQKKINIDNSSSDIELYKQRWGHFVSTELPNPRRLLWQEDYLAAFLLPVQLRRGSIGVEYFWHGLSCLQHAMHRQAMMKFQQAIKSHCNHWIVLWFAASAAYECGDRVAAKNAAMAVVRLAPDFQQAKDMLEQIDRTASRQTALSKQPVVSSYRSTSNTDQYPADVNR